jgi:hypothetical protein
METPPDRNRRFDKNSDIYPGTDTHHGSTICPNIILAKASVSPKFFALRKLFWIGNNEN